MLFSRLVSTFLLTVPALTADVPRLDFDIRKGTNLIDVMKNFVEGITDDLGIDLTPRADGQVDLKNERAFYIANIKVGTPQNEVKVLVDTGSADLWIMSSKNPYCSSNNGDMNCETYGTYDEDGSSTFKDNQTDFSISYLDQTFARGTWGQDTVELSDSLKIENANFAVADETDSNVGVFGIAYKMLESSDQLYDNLPIQMKQQGLIKKVAYSLYLTPAERNTGSILFGAIDHAKYEGELAKFDIPPVNGNNVYLQLPLTDITVKVETEIPVSQSSSMTPTTLQSTIAPHPTIAAVAKRYSNDSNDTIETNGVNALLDSGTTLTYLSQDVLDQILAKIDPNASFNSYMGGYEVSCRLRQPNNYLIYNFDDKKSIQVPLSDVVLIGGQNGQTGQPICMLGIVGNDDHTILGDNFLRHAYTVFDLEDDVISIAQMKYDDENEDIEIIE